MKHEKNGSCKRRSIECDRVLSLFDILRERGFDLTGRLQSRDAFAEYLTMYMADLPSVAKKDARNTSMIFVEIS